MFLSCFNNYSWEISVHQTHLIDLKHYNICIILKRIGGVNFEKAWKIYNNIFTISVNYKL